MKWWPFHRAKQIHHWFWLDEIKYWSLELGLICLHIVEAAINVVIYLLTHPLHLLLIFLAWFAYYVLWEMRAAVLEVDYLVYFGFDKFIWLIDEAWKGLQIFANSVIYVLNKVADAIDDIAGFFGSHIHLHIGSVHVPGITLADVVTDRGVEILDLWELCRPYDSIAKVCSYPVQRLFSHKVCPVVRYTYFDRTILYPVMSKTLYPFTFDARPFSPYNCREPWEAMTCVILGCGKFMKLLFYLLIFVPIIRECWGLIRVLFWATYHLITRDVFRFISFLLDCFIAIVTLQPLPRHHAQNAIVHYHESKRKKARVLDNDSETEGETDDDAD